MGNALGPVLSLLMLAHLEVYWWCFRWSKLYSLCIVECCVIYWNICPYASVLVVPSSLFALNHTVRFLWSN